MVAYLGGGTSLGEDPAAAAAAGGPDDASPVNPPTSSRVKRPRTTARIKSGEVSGDRMGEGDGAAPVEA
jgi:hypothetical protein